LVQISTAYSQQKEGSAIIPRNKYTEIRADKPSSKEEAKRPEFKTCKFASEAIITEGNEKGEPRKVCSNPTCAVHHPVKQASREDGKGKAEQEQRRKEEALANTTGIRVLSAIGAAVPVRLLKRDLQFLLNQTGPLLDEWRLQTLARQHGIRKDREMDAIDKLFVAFVRRADEGMLSRLLVRVHHPIGSRCFAQLWRHDLRKVLFKGPNIHCPPFVGFGLGSGDKGGGFKMALEISCGQQVGSGYEFMHGRHP
jgi:ParB family chromosome partitioning protein